LCIGQSGAGTFEQSAGSVTVGSNDGANIYLGYNSGSAGTYALSGSGSLVVNGSVYIGGTSAAAAGVGTVTISGGSMSVAKSATVYSGSRIIQTGGTLSANQLVVNSGGTFTMNGGSLNVTSLTYNPASVFTVGNGSSPATLNLANGNSYFAQGISVSAMANVTGNGGIDLNPFSGARFSVAGTIAPGRDIDIDGSLVLTSSAVTSIQRVGASQFGLIQATNIALAGQLQVYEDAASEATTTHSQMFVILESSGFSGAFSNIASGQTLTTTDGSASFLVTVTNSYVELSDFQAIPEPGALPLLGMGAIGLLRRRRKPI
jgi:hypothetical protein